MDNLPDWSLFHSFLRVARAGSLSAAARQSGISQPTLSRHMRALEARIGQPLLKRGLEGQRLTSAGLKVLAEAEAMAASAQRIALLSESQTPGQLTGTVRITAARLVAMHYLPPILARLRAEEPELQLELVPSDSPENLHHREADIALRMFRPEAGDLVARRLGELPLGLFASRDYLARRPPPARCIWRWAGASRALSAWRLS